MATFRKRNGKWHVQVRRQGQKGACKSFHRKEDANAWARQMEAQLDREGLPEKAEKLRTTTVADLIDRYDRDVVSQKRCAKVESDMLRPLKQAPFAKLSVQHASPEPFAQHRDTRIKAVKPATVCRELGLLQHMFETARREWGYPLSKNPVSDVRKPTIQNRRERRIASHELDALVTALQDVRCVQFPTLVWLALETAMRRSELLNIQWGDIDWNAGTLHIPRTKNGQARTIPLSKRAETLLSERAAVSDEPGPFNLSPNAVRLAWERLTERAELSDLHFHDLRHEAISRFFEQGLSVPEVALISGHKDYRMLMRYTHLRAETVRNKIQSDEN